MTNIDYHFRRTSAHLASYWHLYASIAITLIVTVLLTWLFFYRLNPDGVSYFKIAQNYASGEIKHAINGYWSPLLSWIITPAYWLGIDPLLFFRILNAILAILPVSALAYLLRTKAMRHKQRVAIFAYLTSLGIVLSLWATAEITPDLLSAVVAVATLFSIDHYIRKPSIKVALVVSTLLALLYFAKSIGLYISVAAIVYLWYRYLRMGTSRRNPFPITALTLCFVALSGIWVSVISLKYDKLTTSTAGPYTFSLIGPSHPTHPQLVDGQLPARDRTASSAWDDPSYLTLESWNPLAHKRYYANYILKNAFSVLETFLSLTPLLIAAGYLTWVYRKKNDHSLILLIASAGVIVCIVYTLVFVESRYLWIVALPIMMVGGRVLSQLQRPSLPLIAILMAILAYSTLSMVPIVQKASNERMAFTETYRLSKNIAALLPKNARVASDTFIFNVCYYANTQCAGIYKPLQNKLAFSNMRKDGIDYYIDFENKKLGTPPTYVLTRPGGSCYDYYLGRTVTCGHQSASIYKIR